MVEVNVANVITIAVISLLGVAAVKMALNAAGKQSWAQYV